MKKILERKGVNQFLIVICDRKAGTEKERHVHAMVKFL